MTVINGGEALVRCLIEEGVRYVFGIPGHPQLTPITDARYRLGNDVTVALRTVAFSQSSTALYVIM